MADETYDEVIEISKHKIKDEEIESLFISEDMTNYEKFIHVFKKGQTVQKSSIIRNLYNYISDKKLISFVFLNLIEYIDCWDSILQIELARSITTIFTKCKACQILTSLENDMNTLIKFIVDIIINSQKNISEEYILCFQSLVEFFKKNKKKVILKENIIDIAVGLGGFGNTIFKRKLSVFLISGFLQISEKRPQSLLNRLVLLFSENEVMIKHEIAYNIRFIVEVVDENFIKSHFFQLFDTLLKDEDINVKLISLESAFLIVDMELIKEEWLKTIIVENSTILLENKNIILIERINIFKTVLKNLSKNSQIAKKLTNIIKNFLKANFLNVIRKTIEDESGQNKIPPFLEMIIEDLHLIFIVLENDMKFVEEFSKSVFTCCFHREQNESLIELNYSGSFESIDRDSVQSTLMNIVIENTSQILSTTPKNLQKSIFLPKYFVFLDDTLERHKELMRTFFNNLEKILKNENFRSPSEFVSRYLQEYPKIHEYILDLFKQSEWNELICIMRSHNCSDLLFSNKDFSFKMLNLAKELIMKNNLKIQTEAIRLIVNILRFSNKVEQEELIYYMNELVNNPSHFTRKLYIIFFDECLKHFSSKFLMKHHIFENYIRFLDESFMGTVCRVIDTFPKFYYLIEGNEKLMNLIQSKLGNLQGKIENDIELKYKLEKFQNFKKNLDSIFFIDLVKNDNNKLENEISKEKKKSKSGNLSEGFNSKAKTVILKKKFINSIKSEKPSLTVKETIIKGFKGNKMNSNLTVRQLNKNFNINTKDNYLNRRKSVEKEIKEKNILSSKNVNLEKSKMFLSSFTNYFKYNNLLSSDNSLTNLPSILPKTQNKTTTNGKIEIPIKKNSLTTGFTIKKFNSSKI